MRVYFKEELDMVMIESLKRENKLPRWLLVKQDETTGRPYFNWVFGPSHSWERFAQYVSDLFFLAKMPLTKQRADGLRVWPEGIYSHGEVTLVVHLEQHPVSGICSYKIEARGNNVTPDQIREAFDALTKDELTPKVERSSGIPAQLPSIVGE